MAQLKDLIVNGASRLIGDTFTNKIQINTVNAPTSSGGSTYGPGSSGQVLKTNGTTIYWDSAGGTGTVTQVTAGTGLKIGTASSGGTITTTGTINHINSVTAQTTQALYPIKIDAQGHISAYGTAVSIPTSAASATTGISISDHSTTTIYGVGSSTTSVTGVQSSTTTASKVTLGTAFSIPNVTGGGSGSFTQGSFSGGSGTFSATVTNHVLSYSHTHTAATHGSDSHTHNAATFGTAFSVPNVTGNSDVTVPIKATSATTVPIKDSSSTTVVTSKTHTVTDNGHTHSLS